MGWDSGIGGDPESAIFAGEKVGNFAFVKLTALTMGAIGIHRRNYPAVQLGYASETV